MSLLIQASKTGAVPKPMTLPYDMIKPAPYLPSVQMDALRFNEMVESSADLMAPIGEILVRPYTDHYEILFGKEYFDAYKEASPKGQVPVTSCTYSDEEAVGHTVRLYSMHLDLNPITVAELYDKAIKHFKWKRSDLARAVGIQRSTVTNRLELLKLTDGAKQFIRAGNLTIEHGKTLSRLKPDEQMRMAKLAVHNNWDTRTLYKKVHPEWNPKGVAIRGDPAGGGIAKDSYLTNLESELGDKLGAPIEFNVDKKKGYKGTIDVKFFGLGELAGLIERFERATQDDARWKGKISLSVSDMDHLNDILGDLNPEDQF